MNYILTESSLCFASKGLQNGVLGLGVKIFGGKVHPTLELRVFRHLCFRSEAACVYIAFCIDIANGHRRKFGQVRGSPAPLPEVAEKLRCRKTFGPSTITRKNRNHSAM